MGSLSLFLSYYQFKLRVVLAVHTVAMVTLLCWTICSPMTEQFFDIMIVASTDDNCYNDPSKLKP